MTPLTPSDCDLRDFQFMPLDVARLRDSDLASLKSTDECWAAILLWGAAWHQVPAGSLPDNDKILAQFAGFGRVVEEWLKVKDGALHNFIKCSDGRLYHPVVAEKAREAWAGKLKQRWQTECARIKKHNQRTGEELPLPSFDAFLAARTAEKQVVPALSLGTNENVPAETAQCPSGNGIQGTGIGTGTGNIEEADASSPDQSEKSVVGKASRKKPSTAIPDGYPDTAAISVGAQRLKEHGHQISADIVAERFRNHALQVDRRCSDWGAAWRNWVIKEIGDRPKVEIGGLRLVPTVDWERRVKSWFGPNRYWDDDWGPRPGRAGCKAPADLIEVYQNRGAA
jgi:hypothetical protein